MLSASVSTFLLIDCSNLSLSWLRIEGGLGYCVAAFNGYFH